MIDLLENINPKHARQFTAAYETGARKFDMMGGRRSGKSYFIEQFLLTRVLYGMVVNVATMTSEQGRLGAYADIADILDASPKYKSKFEITRSPREVRHKYSRGRMFFNSYDS